MYVQLMGLGATNVAQTFQVSFLLHHQKLLDMESSTVLVHGWQTMCRS